MATGNLNINGAGQQGAGSLFGGYIYSIEYNVRTGSEGSSSLTASVVNEKGQYNITSSDLSLERPYSVNIGSINLTMYLKSYRKIKSPSGKLLELQFVDGSFSLDRVFVGLHKRHGNNNSLSSKATIFGDAVGCLVIVGKENLPCDIDNDGNFDNLKDIEDPCHPCTAQSRGTSGKEEARKYLVDCKEESKYNILPVSYNFGDLISKLQHKFKFKNAKDPNPTYRVDYKGSVRSVLSQFCSDFGWIFYWENDVIVFKDLRTVINVNKTAKNFCPNVESDEEEATLDGTVSTITVTNYNRPGRNNEERVCNDAMHFKISPYDANNWGNTTPLGISHDVNEDGAGWAYYDSYLRALYYWFGKYKMESGKIHSGGQIRELGFTFLSDAYRLQGTTQTRSDGIDPFSTVGRGLVDAERDEEGNVVPFLEASVSGYLEEVKDKIEGDEMFKACFECLNVEDQWAAALNIDNKYFFVAHHDASTESRIEDLERKYASDFLGQYHIFNPNFENETVQNFFEDYTFLPETENCGGLVTYRRDGTLDFKAIDAGNASVDYLTGLDEKGKSVGLKTLPFWEFLSISKDSDSSEAVLPEDFKLVVVKRSNNEWYPNPGTKTDDGKGNPPMENINNQVMIGAAFSYYPKQLNSTFKGEGENALEILLKGEDIDLDKGNINIYMGTAGYDRFQLTKANDYNPRAQDPKAFDGQPVNSNDGKSPEDKQEIIYKYPGLRCLPIGSSNKNCFKHILHTPAGDFSFFSPSYGTYNVVIEKNKTVKQKIKKAETIAYAGECPGPQTMNLQVNYQEVNDNSIKEFIKLPNSSTCIFDMNAIQKIHENFSKNLSLNQSTPLIKRTITVAGLDSQNPPGIGDGLMGIRVSLTESGPRTTYELGTIKMVPPANPSVYTNVTNEFKSEIVSAANLLNKDKNSFSFGGNK